LSTIHALVLPEPLKTRGKYPFDQIVAFGDEFSDNGNGSYAHGITGSPATVYGYGTWTNGPVAVSYLAHLLGVRLRDFTFGGCCGGSSFGATLDTAYTKSLAGSPSLLDQIASYTSSNHDNIKNPMEFVCVGQNDLSKHTDSVNTDFANALASKIAASVKTLLEAGAPYVFIANMYPKHLAPVTKTYLCGINTDYVTTWGKVI
jgi:phospholipase/lecithinase/hemolysin